MHPITIGKQTLTWGQRTYVMGILNLTPDSFSGDGLLSGEGQVGNLMEANLIGTAAGADPSRELIPVMRQVRAFMEAGVDILDIGGELTRPGSQPVDAGLELERVLPTLRAIKTAFPDALVSIDTYKAAVAEEAFKAGAQILNDVWGLRADAGLAETAARHKAVVVLMHNRSNPANLEVRERLGQAYLGAEYGDLLEDVKQELLESVALAHTAGIPDDHIILDPGIGFGKTVRQNLELINHLDEIRALGYPVLLGPSRKSFIGYILNLPPDQRLEGTAAALAIGIARGADIVRVHDLPAMLRVARMTDALIRPA